MTTGALEFYCLDEFSLDGTANAVILIGSAIYDAVSVFPIMSRCADDCVVDGHPHESCVDEHIDDSCGCVSDFQTEAVSKETVCGNSDDCGPDGCRSEKCVDEVNGHTCDCDEDHELMLQVNGSVCVAKECEIISRTRFSGADVNVNMKAW